MLKDKKLIYISCKYGGDPERVKLCEQYVKALIERDKKLEKSDRIYFSPLHAFGYLYESVDYVDGLDMTLKMLEKCDAMYIIQDEYETSRGVTIEIGFAKALNIPIEFIELNPFSLTNEITIRKEKI